MSDYRFRRALRVIAVMVTAIIIMRADDSLGIGQVKLGEKHKEGKRVIKPSDEKHPAPFARRQILVEQEKVVAEVKIGLARIACRQTAASEMKHTTFRDYTNFTP